MARQGLAPDPPSLYAHYQAASLASVSSASVEVSDISEVHMECVRLTPTPLPPFTFVGRIIGQRSLSLKCFGAGERRQWYCGKGEREPRGLTITIIITVTPTGLLVRRLNPSCQPC